MSIEIVPWDPDWPRRFAAERDAVAAALRPWIVGGIEHIGSTAVPGLAAKPVIDIMVPVASLEASAHALAAAATIGYLHDPYKAEVMHWLCKPSPTVRTHHLHLVPHHSRLWHERLAFRDALRSDSRLRSEYAALKQHLAAQVGHDREAYTDGKTGFIERVLAGHLEGRSRP
ncbi:MAG: GrpB family protein [Burkholderiaceae bacterium]|nr:GrpB family protein [Burkholderiaceae bacterium]